LERDVHVPVLVFIYAIVGKLTKRTKIGISVNVTERLAQLQTGSPDELTVLAYTPGRVSDETRLHRDLTRRGYHVHGEWFSRELTAWLRAELRRASFDSWIRATLHRVTDEELAARFSRLCPR
jgi:hypothetical protein